jgi:HSP20 family protein
MALMRREPNDALAVRDPFARFFDWPGFARWMEPWRGMEGVEIPVEEFTEGKTHVIRAELPGIDPDKDVEITVSDNTLHLRAERRQRSDAEEGGIRRSEIRYGSFSRSIPLPPGSKESDVQATYKDGMLEVRVPVDEGASGTKRISVSRG